MEPFSGTDPAYARTLAVVIAVGVTYVGNRTFTWRDRSALARRREVALFGVLSLIGYLFSVASLLLSHDVVGLTSRLDDNLSANVVGMALGTAFRFWGYRRFVFPCAQVEEVTPETAGAAAVGDPAARTATSGVGA
jgi:putative flippase GtrA